MMKKIVIAIILIGLIGGGIGLYLYNKPVESLQSAQVDETTTAIELLADFTTDEATATEKYLGKIVQVSGTINNVASENGSTQISLEAEDEMGMMGIICELEKDVADQYQVGNEAIFKGECTGFLDLSGVNLARCVEVK
jgi:hypothetical protein